MPVEHRLLGLDRRTVPFALAGVAVWLVWVVVAPWVNGRVGWDDPVRAGDRVRLTKQVSFTPAAGWGVLGGLRTRDRLRGPVQAIPVSLIDGGVSFTARSGDWGGSSRALLDQIEKITTTVRGGDSLTFNSRVVSVQTASGLPGVLQSFRSPRVEGLIAAFVVGGQGIQLQVVGPPDQLAVHSDEVGRMISSISLDGAGATS